MIHKQQRKSIIAAFCFLLPMAVVARADAQQGPAQVLCCAHVSGATLQGCVFIDPSANSSNECPTVAAICPTLV